MAWINTYSQPSASVDSTKHELNTVIVNPRWLNRRCETQGYKGPTVFIGKNPHVSRHAQPKPVLFKGQLYF